MAKQELHNLGALDVSTGEYIEGENISGHAEALGRLQARRSHGGASGPVIAPEALIIAAKENLDGLYVEEKKEKVRPREFEEADLHAGLPQDVINQIYDYLNQIDTSDLNLQGVDKTYGDAAEIDNLSDLDEALYDAWNYYSTVELRAAAFRTRQDWYQVSALGKKVYALLLKREDLLARGLTHKPKSPPKQNFLSRWAAKLGL